MPFRGRPLSVEKNRHMLFNSYEFIFVFLPCCLLVFFALARLGLTTLSLAFLVAASLFFYGWHTPFFLFILVGSICVNYAFGQFLLFPLDDNRKLARRLLLGSGVVLNLSVLGYYKYAGFLTAVVSGAPFSLAQVALPLAISFFTLQQIAFLADCAGSKAIERDFLRYALFVSFFPQLIAGPIVHHQEMMPQFQRKRPFAISLERFAVGASIFAIGLFKKVIIADTLAKYGDPVFQYADSGYALSFAEAWVGALCFTFQLYFDFSGYSDMAIGLARLFGVRLPANFRSPYKSLSIIEFWRTWHMTLGRFLRDYVYIPLGGSRKGITARHANLMITMVIGGIWHVAGWTFLLWGAFHGVALTMNHLWRFAVRRLGRQNARPRLIFQALAFCLTFTTVVTGWVLFRAETIDGAFLMLRTMYLGGEISLPASLLPLLGEPLVTATQSAGVVFNGLFPNLDRDLNVLVLSFREAIPILLIVFTVVLSMPNTEQLFRRYRPTLDMDSRFRPPVSKAFVEWRATFSWGIATGFLLIVAILGIAGESPFLYFQF